MLPANGIHFGGPPLVLLGLNKNLSGTVANPVESWEGLNRSAWVHLSTRLSICHRPYIRRCFLAFVWDLEKHLCQSFVQNSWNPLALLGWDILSYKSQVQVLLVMKFKLSLLSLLLLSSSNSRVESTLLALCPDWEIFPHAASIEGMNEEKRAAKCISIVT